MAFIVALHIPGGRGRTGHGKGNFFDLATKEHYAEALRGYQDTVEEMDKQGLQPTPSLTPATPP